jgi:glycosyltransferase involved in cell wall biosynthesis
LVCGSLEKAFRDKRRIHLIETMKIGGRIRVPMRFFGTVGTGRIHDSLAAAYIRRADESWDVFHGWPLGSLRSLDQLRNRNIPTVLERPNVHTAEAFQLVSREYARLGLKPQAGNPHRHDAARLKREEEEYAKADFIACPSDFVRDTFIRRGFSEERCLRHRYGFDEESIAFNASVPPYPFRFLFLGRGEPRKGAHYLLEAWQKAELGEKAELCFAGNFEEAYLRYLLEHYDQKGVRYLDFVDDVAGLLGTVHALVLPSIEEGSAIVSYECRGAGLPLLASNSGGAYGTNGQGMLLHRTGDTETLARQMKCLVEDEAYYAELKRQLIALRSELSWTAAGRELGEMYEDIARSWVR